MEKTATNKRVESTEIKEKKTRRIHIVLTESEYKRLLEYSEEYKNVSDFIRERCLTENEKPFEKTKEVKKLLKELTNEMNSVGKNINQAARYSNFLLENKIVFDSINRFNSAIIHYTAIQMKFEKLLKNIFK